MDIERPYPMVSEHLALAWYVDSDDTFRVVMGARVLDWEARNAGQLSDDLYQQRLVKSADEVRQERDGYRAEDAKRRVEQGWARLEALHQDLIGEG